MTHVKKTLYAENISWACCQSHGHACMHAPKAMTAPWTKPRPLQPMAKLPNHGNLVWARSQGMACKLALSPDHGSSRGHVAKAKTTLAGMLPRENQKPIN